MPDAAIAAPAAHAPAAPATDTRLQALRSLGARAHQAHAATRAADHYVAAGPADDRDIGCWLMSCAVDIATEVTDELDAIARGLKETPADAALTQAVQRLRVRSHQLHAAARAADHFLDRDHRDDRETGCWLVACARDLAGRLAAAIDDGTGAVVAVRKPGHVVDAADGAALRRVSHAGAAPVRGVVA